MWLFNQILLKESPQIDPFECDWGDPLLDTKSEKGLNFNRYFLEVIKIVRWVKDFFPLFFLLLLLSCDEKGSVCASCGDSPVTISGTVYNFATMEPEAGVLVYLLDNQADFQAGVTNSDGEYAIELPLGTISALVTDDPEEASSDRWYTVINYDVLATLQFEEEIVDFPLFAVPQPSVAPDGMIAALNHYLQNATVDAGLFPVSNMGDTAGAFLLLHYVTDNGSLASQAGLRVATDTEDFPLGFCKKTECLQGELAFRKALGPNMFLPSSTTETDESGIVFGIGDSSSFSEDIISLTLDHDTFNYQSPINSIFVRPNMLTMTWAITIDGTPNIALRDLIVDLVN